MSILSSILEFICKNICQKDQVSIYQYTYPFDGDKLAGLPIYATPNMGEAITPKYIIIHYTASGNMEGTIRHFQNPESKVSAHLIIGREGAGVAQMMPFNRKAWHAGQSQWGEDQNLNDMSIGIELMNWGLLDKGADGEFYTWTADHVNPDQVRGVKDGSKTFYWQKFTEEQITVCFDIVQDLAKRYSIAPDHIRGHYEISPGRKVDPGPLFPMEVLRQTIKKNLYNENQA